MNSIWLLVTSVCVFLLAYRYYSAFIAAKVLALNDSYTTPAYRCEDGREFVPTNKWVLFGHHFAAIAGAGPLVGPVLAAQYGWGPGFVWILLGSVFAGAVHDFIILFASVRHNGQSLAVIARREVGTLTGITTSLSILFIIIVALAGLAIVVVNALFKNSWGVYTIFMTIPIAIVIGLYMFKISPGSIRSGSIVGFILVMLAVVTGNYIPNSSLAGIFTLTKEQLSIALPLYGFIAAVLPVWLLLAPRDYLSSYMKIGTVLALALGIIIVQPTVNAGMTQFMNGGPIIPGPWWPYVFITIACGAISGFHSLISSGTTPKMLELESQARLIAYGGMLTEGFVAVMALISAVVLLPGDFFAINTPAAVFAKLNMPIVELNQLSALVGMDVAHRPGGAVSLAVGMAHIFSSIGGMSHLMSYWYQFAIMFEALFILTTIDAGTRVARYILQDILGTYVYAPLKQTNWWPGILITSALVTWAWGYLLYSGDVASIWPLFGVANQLLSVIALALGTTIILKVAPKKSYAWVTAAPLAFLAVTVITAGILNVGMFYRRGDMLGNINGTVSIVLIVLVIITLLDSFRAWNQLLKKDKPEGMNTEIQHVCVYNDTKPNIPS
ncbi:carbon starvation protein [Anaerospora hongkongensis]|uniref:Carbon starvation protein n=2 Tax=Anaerospora hongkongensis TaxID=244830 RepID=A0A4R1Q280_9FIRM|nr:carbon starvation protein A [Anaerospora hongkongensis]TCL40050.1 carbon starvation protein [Anaerospora hongkongensis]